MVTEFHHGWYAGLKFAPRKTWLTRFIASAGVKQGKFEGRNLITLKSFKNLLSQ